MKETPYRFEMDVKKSIHVLSLMVLLCGATSFLCDAQVKQEMGEVMSYIVQNGDTLFVDELPAARIDLRGNMSDKEWKIYYKRVHNFSKAYPYALFVAQAIRETDSLFVARNYNKRDQDKYLEKMKGALLKSFEPVFRKLTLAQGMMMIRLIDREVGKTPYLIIKQYLGGINAGFWQGIAKLFSGDLKKQYDPKGEDKDLEELVGYWKSGEFPDIYYMIFGKEPPEIYIPPEFQEPFYKSVETPKARKAKSKKR
ncbi:MAG: DUF4294 domain-containing protein [Bacteroidales bacterium]|nr:DUF4294 domain-containing protein [Bacteroidales bacterium]